MLKHFLLSKTLNDAFIVCENCLDKHANEQGSEVSELSDDEYMVKGIKALDRRKKDFDFVNECEICNQKLK